MNAKETAIYNSGHDVGLAVADYTKELNDFPPLKAANVTRGELVDAIKDKTETQDTNTTAATTDKEEQREKMAVATDVLSARAVGYALDTKQLGLKQAFTLTYADVRYGDADEDVNHVRELVAKVQALPQTVRELYRLTDAVIQAPADAADDFEKADDTKTNAKAAPRLATLALPELLRQLSAVLLVMKSLIKGQRTDTDKNFQWPALHAAFTTANKRRVVASKKRPVDTKPRLVRTLPLTVGDGQPVRLANTNYGAAYTLTVENQSANDLLLWMAQKDGAQTTPGLCPAGAVTVLTRADIGPATARYLTAQFVGESGGQATVQVRRVVTE